MGWRADTEPHDVMQFLGKGLVTRQFEAAPAVRRKPCSCQILTTEEAAIPMSCPSHAVPVRGLLPGRFQRQHDELINQFRVEGRDGWSALVAQKAIDALGHETLLPSPHTGLRFAGCRHDRHRSQPVLAHQDDLSAPYVFLRRTAVRNDGFEPNPVGGGDVKCNPGALGGSSHIREPMESQNGLFCLDHSTRSKWLTLLRSKSRT